MKIYLRYRIISLLIIFIFLSCVSIVMRDRCSDTTRSYFECESSIVDKALQVHGASDSYGDSLNSNAALFSLIAAEACSTDGVSDIEEAIKDLVQDVCNDDCANINARNDREYTPLHEAAAAGLSHVIEILLELGAEIDIVNAEDETPLALAVRYGQEAAVSTLLDNGALVTHKALDAAAEKPALKELLNDAIKERCEAKRESVQR